ncbi:MAG: class I SAM-dependent rRNA methyltransferase [Rhodobacteraceae bacterium]|nr:class I SAM-dependent rRNA methyltransferase [Paracoccaceae bacterium]
MNTSSVQGPLPQVRLRPKAPARALRFGAPWAYADDIVMDRRTRAIAPGSIVALVDDGRAPIGLAAFNPVSRIAARLLTRDSDADIDADWIAARIAHAAALRNRLHPEPFYRLVHAEGDGLPGLVIDRFGDTAVVQPNAAWADVRSDEIATALQGLGMGSVWLNASGRARGLEGLDDISRPLAGPAPGVVEVPMNGATYMADLAGGQKTGLFFDQRPNHAFAAALSRGGRVLDLFSHVGGFALAALAAGATRALAVDSSAPAIDLAEAGARTSGTAERLETRRGDCFELAQALAAEGALFETVISDPPAFAPARPALEAGLRAYERIARAAAALVAPGGFLVLCSCSHAADMARFRAACLAGLGRAGRSGQILHVGTAGPDHPVHPHLAETGYLKALFLRLD